MPVDPALRALVVSGDGLGAAEDVLVVIGVLVVTSPVTGTVPQRVSVIGSVLAPRGSEPALGPVLAGCVGSVGYYRYADGQDIKVLTGQVKLSGAILANPAGQPDDILIAAGQVVTGPVTAVAPAPTISPGLDPAWWRHFTAGFTARMITSTQPKPCATASWRLRTRLSPGAG